MSDPRNDGYLDAKARAAGQGLGTLAAWVTVAVLVLMVWGAVSAIL